jgi:hypothetical protein
MKSSKFFGVLAVILLCGLVAADEPKTKTARVFMPDFDTKDKAVTSIDVIQVIDAKAGKSDAHHYTVTDKTKFIMAIGSKETEFNSKTVLTDKMAPNYFKKNVWVTVTVQGKELVSVKFTNRKEDLRPGPGVPIKP